MLEVPFSLVLFIIILIFVLGVFSIVMIVRMVMQQMKEREEEEEGEGEQEAASSAPVSQESKAGSLPVPEHCRPLLLIGLNDRQDEFQFFRAGAGMSAIKAGQVSRTDGILLKKVAQCIQLLTAVPVESVEKEPISVEPVDAAKAVNAVQSMPVAAAPISSVKPKAAVQPSAVSVAAQINEVLQTLLSTSSGAVPNLRVDESPTGDVRIWLDSQSYSSIEEVPNPTAAALLRRAADLWSKSHPQ